MFFINNKEEEFKMEKDTPNQQRWKSRDSHNNELDKINDSILSKGSKKEQNPDIDDKLAANILKQLKQENNDIFR